MSTSSDISNARLCAFTTVWLLQSVILPRPAQVLLANERLDADVDLNRIAEATDSFSGSDLNALCTAAAMIPVRELLRATGKSAQVRAHMQRMQESAPLSVTGCPASATIRWRLACNNTQGSLCQFRCAYVADDGYRLAPPRSAQSGCSTADRMEGWHVLKNWCTISGGEEEAGEAEKGEAGSTRWYPESVSRVGSSHQLRTGSHCEPCRWGEHSTTCATSPCRCSQRSHKCARRVA